MGQYEKEKKKEKSAAPLVLPLDVYPLPQMEAQDPGF
jgi:hypothetical protein